MKKKLLLFISFVLLVQFVTAQVASVRPNRGYRGQTLTTTITLATGVMQFATPPQGYMDIYLQQGANVIYTYTAYQALTNMYYSTGFPFGYNWYDSLITDFPIPLNASLGYYDVHVITYSGATPVDNVLINGLLVRDIAGSIQGNVFFDTNQNGIWDLNEPPLAYQAINIGPNSEIAYSGASGSYIYTGDTGVYNLSPNIPPGWVITTSPTSYSVALPPSSSGYDFGLYSASLAYRSDLRILRNRQRCNVSGAINVTVSNTGYLDSHGSVTVIVSSNVSITGYSTPPNSINGDTLTWIYPTLSNGQVWTVEINNIAPAAGQIVSISVIDSVFNTGGIFQNTVIDDYSYVVRCAYDPNDKSATPSGTTSANYTPINQDVEYLVRFQNTGNDYAYEVIIYDTLDARFDPTTFSIVDASHNLSTQISSAGEIQFSFYNINLPDSGLDEVGSHGWLRYKVHARTSIPDPSVVHNTAYIVFDQNVPIITNTTMNTLTALQYPNADFTTSDPSICQASCITFNNLSSNATTYQWLFPGSTTPSSTSVLPSGICYTNVGSFDVTLIATNPLGSDTTVQQNYISVAQGPIGISVTQIGDTLFATSGFTSYQWYYNTVPIGNATGSYYVATADGDYAVVVTNAAGCSGGANIPNVVTGVTDMSLLNRFVVYPNPSTGTFELKFSASKNSMVAVELLDNVGQVISSHFLVSTIGINTMNFNEENLSAGLYMIKVVLDHKSMIKLISINK